MRNIAVLLIMISSLSGMVACIREGGEAPKQKQERQNKGEEIGLAGVLKDKSLSGYPTTTIGKAFDGYGYFTRKEWKATQAANGKIFIDFIGWFDSKSLDARAKQDKVYARGISVKFCIYPDGSFNVVMVTKLDAKSDGTFYQGHLPDSKEIFDRIYGNKEIRFINE
jgi:hypothetical protein